MSYPTRALRHISAWMGLLAIAGCSKQPAAPPQPPPTVLVMQAVQRTAIVTDEVVGEVRSARLTACTVHTPLATTCLQVCARNENIRQTSGFPAARSNVTAR